MDVRAMEQLLENLDRRVERIEQILPTLATKDELRAEVEAEGERTRRHFDIVAESLRDDIRLIAEGQAALTHGVAAMRTELKQDIAGLARRLIHLEGSRS